MIWPTISTIWKLTRTPFALLPCGNPQLHCFRTVSSTQAQTIISRRHLFAHTSTFVSSPFHVYTHTRLRTWQAADTRRDATYASHLSLTVILRFSSSGTNGPPSVISRQTLRHGVPNSPPLQPREKAHDGFFWCDKLLQPATILTVVLYSRLP